MPIRTIRKKFKRYRHRNQPYHPGMFRAFDLLVEGSKLLMFAAVFITIFSSV